MYCASIFVENLKLEEPRSSNELVVAVTPTVVVFLMISILTLITGFACGYYIRGRKCKASQLFAVPFYEDVDVLPSAMEHQ